MSTEHCMHALLNQIPVMKVCCHCGLRQVQNYQKAPGHGPHAPHDAYVWLPPVVGQTCPARVPLAAS